MTQTHKTVLMLLPSLRISGGTKEAVRLLRDLRDQGLFVRILSFWKHAYQIETYGIDVDYLLDTSPDRRTAVSEAPRLIGRYLRYARQFNAENPDATLILTHFTTFLPARIGPRFRWVCFNQDFEWLFVPDGVIRKFVKHLILSTSRKAKVITTNEFVTHGYTELGVPVFGEAAIWAEAKWLNEGANTHRPLDVTLLLRNSPFKRLDLGLDLLRRLRERGHTTCVITPDSNIVEMVKGLASEVRQRPSDEEMKQIFASSKLFLLLSDVEGFGLPPLEAMGSGSIAVCRDSGGVRCYMTGPFAKYLIPFDEPAMKIYDEVVSALEDGNRPSPQSAIEHFKHGLRSTEATRRETIIRLAEALR